MANAQIARQQLQQQKQAIQSAKLAEVSRRELQKRTLQQATQRRGQAIELESRKGLALSQLQKVEQQFEKAVGAVTLPAEKRRAAYQGLISAINFNLRTTPYSLSGRGVTQAREIFQAAGLDPAEAEKIYKKAIKTSGAYRFGEERTTQFKDLEKKFGSSIASAALSGRQITEWIWQLCRQLLDFSQWHLLLSNYMVHHNYNQQYLKYMAHNFQLVGHHLHHHNKVFFNEWGQRLKDLLLAISHNDLLQ